MLAAQDPQDLMPLDLGDLAARMVSPDAHTRVRGAIEFFRMQERCDSFLIAFKNPRADDYCIIHNRGYSDSVAAHLTSDLENLPEFNYQFRHYNVVTTWEEHSTFRDSYSGAQVLRPEGFNNGLLMVLHDGHGTPVGICQGNIERDRFGESSQQILESMRPTFTDYVTRYHRRASFGLTTREQEIVELLRQGLSNAEIGDRLVLSTRTVSTHMERILRKLGVTNRVAAALQAGETFPAPTRQ